MGKTRNNRAKNRRNIEVRNDGQVVSAIESRKNSSRAYYDHYHLALCNDYTFRSESFGGILYNRKTKRPMELNEVAAEIISLCRGELSVNSIIRILSRKYACRWEEIESDVISFTDSCLSQEMLSYAGKTAKHAGNRADAIFNEQQSRRDLSNELVGYERFAAPLYIELFPTLVCNLNCKFCYIHATRRLEKNGFTDFNIFRKLVNEMSNLKVFELDILGGEPFLVPWITEGIELAITHGIVPNVSTNGTLITKEIAKKLSHMGLIDIQISLEASRPEIHDMLVGVSGAWKKAIESTKLLLEHGIDVQFNTIVTNYNFEDLPGLILFSEKLGVGMVSLAYMQHFGNAERYLQAISIRDFWKIIADIDEMYNRSEHNMKLIVQTPFEFLRTKAELPKTPYMKIRCLCKAGTSKLSIMPDGSIFPCELFGVSNNNQDYLLGNIKDISIEEAWNADVLQRFWGNLNMNLPKLCTNCQYSDFCKGGCAAYRLKNYHEKYTRMPDPRCPLVCG